jgi:hypothetical protein
MKSVIDQFMKCVPKEERKKVLERTDELLSARRAKEDNGNSTQEVKAQKKLLVSLQHDEDKQLRNRKFRQIKDF